MKKLALGWIAATMAIAIAPSLAPASDSPPAPERALIVIVKWDPSGVTIDTVTKRELAVPAQLGFPQLWSRFFELRDKDGDVHYAGPLVDSREHSGGSGSPKNVSTFRLILPDLDDARHLVIIQRISSDPEKGRKIMLEKDL